MARYRTYKNGITGHRYKGYYIIKGEAKGLFQIWREDKSVYQENIYDYDDCEWFIDKETATQKELLVMNQLYDLEIYRLTALLMELMQKRDQNKLDAKDKELYKWVEKIRDRKISDKEF